MVSAAAFGMRTSLALFWLAVSCVACSAACGKAATSSAPTVAPPPNAPSAQEQACAHGFTLSPDTLARCAASHKGACYPSIEDACTCAGCAKCMVLESKPMLVACGQ